MMKIWEILRKLWIISYHIRVIVSQPAINHTTIACEAALHGEQNSFHFFSSSVRLKNNTLCSQEWNSQAGSHVSCFGCKSYQSFLLQACVTTSPCPVSKHLEKEQSSISSNLRTANKMQFPPFHLRYEGKQLHMMAGWNKEE